MKRIIILLIILVFSIAGLWAQNQAGTVGAPWLKISPDARAIGMGGSVVASVNDATSLYWNPAGAASMEKIGVHFTNVQWLFDVVYNFGAIAVPTDMGTFGFSFTSLSMDEEEITTVDEQNGTGRYYDAGDVAVGFSYARKFTDKFSFGLNIKYINEHIMDCSRSAVAVDLGSQYVTGLQGLKIGMSISNVGTELQYKGKNLEFDTDPNDNGTDNHALFIASKDALPIIFRFGVTWEAFNDGQNVVNTSVNLEDAYDMAEVANIGVEYAFNNMIFVRGGYKYSDQAGYLEGLSFGGGLNYDFGGFAAGFNYSYSMAENDDISLDPVNRMSLDMSF